MVSKTYILKELSKLSKLHTKSYRKDEQHFYSKLALIECCGWIEQNMDNLVFCVKKFIKKSDNQTFFENLVGKNYNLFIYEGTIEELKAVERKGDKNKKFLPLIVKMLNIYNFKIIKSDIAYIDEQILSNVDDNVIIATNDKELRQKLQKKYCQKVMYMRQKSYLEIA